MKKIKTVIYYVLCYIRYIFSKIFQKNPHIADVKTTIRRFNEPEVCCGRYGDGEINLIYGTGIGFQKYDKELAKRLKQIITLSKEQDKQFLVCLSDVFGNLSFCKPEARKFWHEHMVRSRTKWLALVQNDKLYYNTFSSRFYSLYLDKSHCKECVELWKNVWNEKKVLIVEGEGTRLGIGNDLLNNAETIERVLCPAENAWSKYDEILSYTKSIGSEYDLLLVALGPTATVMCYDLYKAGIKALDVGHIDLEYEWYKLGTMTRQAIPGKYVNEVQGANQVFECNDEKYLSQIIKTIL